MSTYIDTTQLVANRDSYRLVRERSFTSSHEDLLEVLKQLRSERVTGTLTVNLSQGGINRVHLREEQDIPYEP